MTNLRVSLFVFLFIFVSINLSSQELIYTSDNDELQNNYYENNTENNSKVLKKKKQKISYNINMGSSFSSASYGSSLNLYTVPKINYDFTPKLSFSTGFIFMNTTINSNNTEGSSNSNQSFLYNSINYKASERLKISGEILYGMNNSSFDVNNKKKNNNYYLRFNAEYKITKNFTVGIQVAKDNRNYYNPFTTPSYNPFYNNEPFSNNMFGTW